jgi:hypothetical protein
VKVVTNKIFELFLSNQFDHCIGSRCVRAVFVALALSLLMPLNSRAVIADLPIPSEAESAVNVGGVQASDFAGYTGTGYVEFSGEGSLEWSITAPRDGLYQFSIRYALDGTSAKTFSLRENNYAFVKANQTFVATGKYDNYRAVDIYAKLTAGAHVIRLESSGAGLPHIDHLLVTFTPPDSNKFLTFPIHSSDVMFAGTSANADAYYKAIDPKSERKTLDNWKAKNAMTGTANYGEATYLNAGDLGFGRHMYVQRWQRDGDTVKSRPRCKVAEDINCNVSSYVQNYPTLQDAVDGTRLLATVAMEYAPPIKSDGSYDTAKPKFSKFYVFDAAGNRVNKVDLDGRGEKFVPGLCNVCHGGKPKLDNVGVSNLGYSDGGDTGARWIPWDLDTFEFHPDKTRESQEIQFKRLNHMVLDAAPTGASAQLIKGWYGGESLPNSVFDSRYVPKGWSSTAEGDKSKLYKEVISPSCRSCHYQREVRNNTGHVIYQGEVYEHTLTFSTYDSLKQYKKEIEYLVYDAGLMPVAKRTYENFWRSNQAVTLDNEMFGGTALQSPSASLMDYNAKQDFGAWRRPGRPQPNIAGIPSLFGAKTVSSIGSCNQVPIYDLPDVRVSTSATTVRLIASPSLFPSSYSWSFIDQNTCATSTTPEIRSATSAVASFTLEADRTAPFYIKLRATNEFSSVNRMIIGRVYPESALPRISFVQTIYPMLVKDKYFSSADSDTAKSCIDCHSSAMLGRAHQTFDLMDLNIPEDPVHVRMRFAFRMALTRVDCKNPENSLLLRKPAGHAHYGGTVYGWEDQGNSGDLNNRAKILRWIMEGARFIGSGAVANDVGCPSS